jgi:tetratricopeptide (TPR) repeat protein
MMKAVKIFLSYANNDRESLDTLVKQLSPLQQRRAIESWYRGKMKAGSDWRRMAESYLDGADLILLLISPDFVVSEVCCEIEMSRAMQRHTNGEARVIPVILRPTDWSSLPCGGLWPLPSDARPVTLWQSLDAAFSDIVEGIKKVVSDITATISSLTANKTPQIWTVPYRRNPFFTGRDDILVHLYDNFTTSKTPIIREQVLNGLGGIGKTQIAIEYAYQYQQNYQAILWVRADSLESMTASFITLAQALNLPEQHDTEQQVITTAIKRWLQKQTLWLLILDNVEDFEMIHDFLPLMHNGHVIITTRSEATGAFVHTMHVSNMDWQEGTLLLLRRSKMLTLESSLSDSTEATSSAGRDIAELLGGLPLALDQAGAYIDETHASLVDYLARYNQQSAKLLQRRGKLAFDHPQSVAVTFTLAFERIQQASAVSADLLRFLTFLHPDTIPEEILSEGADALGFELQSLVSDPFGIDAAVEELLKFSLICRNPEIKMLSLHRLIQTVLKSTMSEQEQRQWAERAVQMLNLLFPHAEFESWDRAERYLSNAQVCVDLVAQWDIQFAEAAHLLLRIGQYFYERGLYRESEKCLQRALTIGEQVFGPEHPDTATIFHALGALLRNQSQYVQSEKLFQRALAIREQVLTADHPDTATTLDEFGDLYLVWGKFNEAELLYQRALTIREQVLGKDHPDTAATLNNLAALYSFQGKYTEAEPLYLRSLAIREQVLGSEHPRTADSLNNLARLYRIQGQYEQAEPLFLRALTIREQTLGPEHPYTAQSISRLADLYSAQQKYEQAEPLFLKGLTLREQTLGSEHRDTAYSLDDLGMLYSQQGRYAEAEPLIEHALRIREQILQPNHPLIALSLYRLALVYQGQNRSAQAEPLLQRALNIREQVLGPTHPETVEIKELLQGKQ